MKISAYSRTVCGKSRKFLRQEISRPYRSDVFSGETLVCSRQRDFFREFVREFPGEVQTADRFGLLAKIVSECEKVDAECAKAQSNILKSNTEINQLIEQIHNDVKCPIQTVDKISTSVEYGSSAKSKKVGKVPVIRMGNIQDGRIDWSDLVYSNDDEEISKYQLKKYDVL